MAAHQSAASPNRYRTEPPGFLTQPGDAGATAARVVQLIEDEELRMGAEEKIYYVNRVK